MPGPIFSEQSKGTHNLIKMGAKLVAEVEDILCELPIGFRPEHNKQETVQNRQSVSRSIEEINEDSLNKKEWKKILECLSDVPLHIDRLTAMCNMPAQDIALGLLELQLAGKVVQLPGQNYVLQRKV